MQKKNLIIIGLVAFVLIVAYTIYSFSVGSNLAAKHEEVKHDQTSYFISKDDESKMSQVEELSEKYPEFFNGSGMTAKEIVDTETGQKTLESYEEHTAEKVQELNKELDEIVKFSAIDYSDRKAEILVDAENKMKEERKHIERFDAFRLENFDKAQKVCKDEINFGDLFTDTPEGDQDNLTFMLLNAQENLCDKL